MVPRKILFRYKFNIKDDNAQEVLDYFNGSGFSKYLGKKQEVNFKDGRGINGKVFEFYVGNNMADVSDVLCKKNKFIPQEVSCENPGAYHSLIELVLKGNFGKDAKLKRGPFDLLFNQARIKFN